MGGGGRWWRDLSEGEIKGMGEEGGGLGRRSGMWWRREVKEGEG